MRRRRRGCGRSRAGPSGVVWPGAVTEPSVLDHGRSPAPKVVGDLLVALRAAGSSRTAPRCAGCERSRCALLHRRGEDWYCASACRARKACAACGQVRQVALGTGTARPRCAVPARMTAGPRRCRLPGGQEGRPSSSTPSTSPRRVDRCHFAGRPAPPTGLGAAGPPRAADRGRRRGACSLGAAPHRRPLRGRCDEIVRARPARIAAGLSTLIKDPDGLRIVPELRGPMASRAVCPLRRRPRASGP